MGINLEGRWHIVGKILAALSEGNGGRNESSGDDDDIDKVSVPDKYRAEALMYDVVSRGLIPFHSLADGTVDMQTFFRAKRLVEFEGWLKDKAKSMAQAKKDVVEYFE